VVNASPSPCASDAHGPPAREQPGNGFFGLAIGFTVTAGAFAGRGISGLFNHGGSRWAEPRRCSPGRRFTPGLPGSVQFGRHRRGLAFLLLKTQATRRAHVHGGQQGQVTGDSAA